MLRARLVKWRRQSLYRRILRRGGVIVLRYHSVGHAGEVERYLSPGLSLDPNRFRSHLQLLQRHFTVISADELRIKDASGPFERMRALVTFDDGYRDNYEQAFPILMQEGVPAIFFIATDPILTGRPLWTSELWRLVPRLPAGRLAVSPDVTVVVPPGQLRASLRTKLTQWLSSLPAQERELALDRIANAAGCDRGEGLADVFMTSDDLKVMRRAGMAVGAHTRSHPHLDRLPEADQTKEVQQSKRDLEEILGESVDHFAYPNPGGGMTVAAAARRSVESAGFRTAFTSIPGAITANADPLGLPRVGVFAGEQECVLFDVVSAVHPA